MFFDLILPCWDEETGALFDAVVHRLEPESIVVSTLNFT
jgi:hypothetical protein